MRSLVGQSRLTTNSMKGAVLTLVVLAITCGPASANGPKTVKGLKNPESVVVGPGGRIYVTLMGEVGKSGDGSIAIVDVGGKVTPFATGLDDPRGVISVGNFLYVADVKKVWKVDARGRLEVFLDAGAFPRPPGYLEDISHDGLGNFYVSDAGNRGGGRGAVYQVDPQKRVTQVLDGELSSPQIAYPKGVIADPPDHLFVADFALGYLYRYDLNTRNAQRIGGGFGAADGLAREAEGALFVADGRNGRIYQITTDLEPPILVSEQIRSPAGIYASPDGKMLLVIDTKAGTLTWLPTR